MMVAAWRQIGNYLKKCLNSGNIVVVVVKLARINILEVNNNIVRFYYGGRIILNTG
jgi:hypothetical protein